MGSAFANAGIRASAAAICALSGASTAKSGANFAFDDRTIVCLDEQLTLALVQIRADALPGGWPYPYAPRQQTMSA
jgi:hypothetical protein